MIKMLGTVLDREKVMAEGESACYNAQVVD